MNPEELKSACEHATRVARDAGALVMEGFRGEANVRSKAIEVDLVTDYDLASEKQILAALSSAYPDVRIVGEEADGPGARGDDTSLTWYVDPIDGTTNFAHGHPFFCVSIGLLRGGAPLLGVIYAPALDVCWAGVVGQGATRNGQPCQVSSHTHLKQSLCATGFPHIAPDSPESNFAEAAHFKRITRGVRRCGSAALDLAMTADGTYDAYWEYLLNPWDVAAGASLIVAAGGRVTSEDGSDVDLRDGALVASNPHVHDAVIEQLSLARGGRAFPLRSDAR